MNSEPYYDYNQENSGQTSDSTDIRYWVELDRSNIAKINKNFVSYNSDSSTKSLYIPVQHTSYRLYSILDDIDYIDDLVETKMTLLMNLTMNIIFMTMK